MPAPLTIAIVTKRRPQQLARCLASLCWQTVHSFEVLVVDNDSTGSAECVVAAFKENLSITYLQEARPGVPFARNTAIENVTTPFLAFIDDDCVVEKHWVEQVLHTLAIDKKNDYWVGASFLFANTHPLALAVHQYQTYWFNQKIVSAQETSPFNLDTKNCVFKRATLVMYNLRFDIHLSIGHFDSADTDLGFQLAHVGCTGRYLPSLKVWHEESVSLRWYLQKAFSRGRLAARIAQKWQLSNEFVALPLMNWVTYVRTLRQWPAEYFRYFRTFTTKGMVAFLLIKLYERFFLFGFVREYRQQHRQ